MNDKKCKYIKNIGVKCNANHIIESEYCFRHEPKYIDKAQQASKKGGENRRLQEEFGEEISLQDPAAVKLFIGTVINSVWTGKAPTQLGTAMGFLAKCWLEAHNASEMQNRIEVIEKRLDKVKS